MTEPLFTILGVKLSVLQGAAAGTAISLLLSTGTPMQRLRYAVVGALFAVYGTEGAIELTRNIIPVTDSTQRLGGLVFGLVGVILTESLIKAAKRIRDNDGIGAFISKWLAGWRVSRDPDATPPPRVEPPVGAGPDDPLPPSVG